MLPSILTSLVCKTKASPIVGENLFIHLFSEVVVKCVEDFTSIGEMFFLSVLVCDFAHFLSVLVCDFAHFQSILGAKVAKICEMCKENCF